jgi:hypothetical protein
MNLNLGRDPFSRLYPNEQSNKDKKYRFWRGVFQYPVNQGHDLGGCSNYRKREPSVQVVFELFIRRAFVRIESV